MFRRSFQVLMLVALVLCIASLLESIMTRSVRCPICGGRAVYQKSVGDSRASPDTGEVHAVDFYFCEPCDAGVIR